MDANQSNWTDRHPRLILLLPVIAALITAVLLELFLFHGSLTQALVIGGIIGIAIGIGSLASDRRRSRRDVR